MQLSHWIMRVLSCALILTFSTTTGFAETIEEKFPDGKVKSRYSVDGQNRKNGMLEEFFGSGKLKIKANYKDDLLDGSSITYFDSGKIQITANYKKGKLHGAYAEYTEAGVKKRAAIYKDGELHGAYAEFTETGERKQTANYKDGKLDGARTQFEKGKPVATQTFKDGNIVFGRSAAEIKKKIAEITAEPKKKLEGEAAELDAALRRLKAYRYLAEVPYEDLTLDAEKNRHCVAASKLCEKIGRLDHKPDNPGWPEADYKFAYEGTSHSNLAKGDDKLWKAMDSWMDDSDRTNIDRVGHRRWCLDPSLQKTGFGRVGKYSAMWVIDEGREIGSEVDFVAWPAKGYMPSEYFGPRIAWSVSFNPAKYSFDPSAVKAGIFEVDKNFSKGKALKLNYLAANTVRAGIPNGIVFRPEAIDLSPGKRYLVEVEGVGNSMVRYYVEFIRLD